MVDIQNTNLKLNTLKLKEIKVKLLNEIPVKEGEEYEVKIEAKGSKGDGIAKIEGYVIFIPNTKIGDEVKVRINRALRGYAFAEVVD